MDDEQKFKELVEKIQQMKKGKELDLSLEEDLSIAVMNLISLEEHFFFTASKTEKPEYFDLLKETREIRKSLLGKLIDKHEGETWCACKHLLAATMRLIEVGAKLLGDGKKNEAEEFFKQAYKLYAFFWGLRLKLIDISDLKKIPAYRQAGLPAGQAGAATNKPWTAEDIVNKLVDCCDE